MYTYDVFDKEFNYLGLVVCKGISDIKNQKSDACYFLRYDYFTRQPDYFESIEPMKFIKGVQNGIFKLSVKNKPLFT